MTIDSGNNRPSFDVQRSSDGCPVHPGHSYFFLFRLLIGSLTGGMTAMLAFFLLGFLGSIDFVGSIDLAVQWLLIGGAILGIILGVVFSLIAALLVNLLPPLRRTVHPLAIVRMGFLIAILAPFFILIGPQSSPAFLVLGPVAAILLGLAGLLTNRHAELVPHSTSGRLIGTSIGPFLIFAALLAILIPMLNRGFGEPKQPEMIVIALDSVDGPLLNEYLNSDDGDRLPNLWGLREQGGSGLIGASQPMIASRLWADLLTGMDYERHGILDRHSSSDDLDSLTVWEILDMYEYRVGLFEMPPAHHTAARAVFDVPPPENSGFEIRSVWTDSDFHSIWQVPISVSRLARLGVRLDTIAEILETYAWRLVVDPDPELIFQKLKLIEFEIQTDRALALLWKNPVDAALLRFNSLSPLFQTYWRYAKPGDFGPLPADIDAALAVGLGRVIPDACQRLDGFIADLEPYMDNDTVLALVSNHGISPASDTRFQHLRLSPDRFLEAVGLQNRLHGDTSAAGICVRPVDAEADQDLLEETEHLLSDTRWTPGTGEESSRPAERSLFSYSGQAGCLEIHLITRADLTADAIVTMGDWSGPLSDLLIEGDPPTGLIAGSGLFLVRGPQFRPDGVANPEARDVVPTLLRALDIELSREFEGRVLNELFRPTWLNEHLPTYTENYSQLPPEDTLEETTQPSAQPEEAVDLSAPHPEGPVGATSEPLEFLNF